MALPLLHKIHDHKSAVVGGVMRKEMSEQILPVKDEDNSHPIATEWRQMFELVVCKFVKDDFELNTPVRGVLEVEEDVAEHNRKYVNDYGEKLVELSPETWVTSCAQWMGSHWDVLVDLCTDSEGVSDLVLTGKVTEVDDGFVYSVGYIYVP